ncbi:MAG TPA: hypothetical protein VFK79_17155 [Xanthobacteraceae bacterium]|nr:hypothetical protein [Xanthobacteraceae bacterium]
MRSILASVIVGAALLGIPAAVRAEALLWDGSVVITAATSQCNAIGEPFSPTKSLRALWRPRLKAGDPKAAIIFQTDSLSHIYVIRAISNVNSLNGTGDYCGIDFDPGVGESTTWFGGRYNITVTPAPVTAHEVQVIGWATKFGNVPGCTVRFRGAFERRATD